MAAEPYAYGELGLLPCEFYRLTPREYRLRSQGHEREQQRIWLMVGRLGVATLSPHWTKKVKAKEGPLTLKHVIGFFPNPLKYLKRS